jgi:hypothetical protein
MWPRKRGREHISWRSGRLPAANVVSSRSPATEIAMQVKYKMFRGTLTSWDELFENAARFATDLGEIRVINISHSCAGSDGVVTVWYWSD